MSINFKSLTPTQENCWRASILIGENDKCYKFALGKALLKFSEKKVSEVYFSDLTKVYAKEICDHLKISNFQGSSRKPKGKVITACEKFNNNEIGEDEMIENIKKDEWVVLKKFHLVKGQNLPYKFFEKGKKVRNSDLKIFLTDDLLSLRDNSQFTNLSFEIDGRWDLLSRSWELKKPYHTLMINYDLDNQLLITYKKNKRVAITGARDGLNGYQKGQCFYCFSKISIKPKSADLSDVDHFFPLYLEKNNILKNLNGIWNLVLACSDCNRGVNGKFDKLPKIKFLERLNIRNNYLISSHDPLRQILLAQTGITQKNRFSFLNKNFNIAQQSLIHSNWEPKKIYQGQFLHENVYFL